MKKLLFFLIFFLNLENVFAAAKYPSLDGYCLFADGKDEDVTAKYLARDFSAFFIPRSEPYYQFLGIIGKEYQRLYIVFTKVTKDKNDPRIYLVEGYSKVKNNKNDFVGKITIEKIFGYGPSDIMGDDEQINDESKASITIFAKYEFLEDKAQKFSGKFSGKMWLGGYINMENKFITEEPTLCPQFRNNQYEGVWQSYVTAKTKLANWGQHQIPGVDPHDDPSGGGTGCGGFGADPKYYKRGWSKEELPPAC